MYIFHLDIFGFGFIFGCVHYAFGCPFLFGYMHIFHLGVDFPLGYMFSFWVYTLSCAFSYDLGIHFSINVIYVSSVAECICVLKERADIPTPKTDSDWLEAPRMCIDVRRTNVLVDTL